MAVTAEQLQVSIPGRASLKTMLSGWENGRNTSRFYTDLLCRVFEIPSPYGPTAQQRRLRCGNSRVFTRVFDRSGWSASPPARPDSYLQVGAR